MELLKKYETELKAFSQSPKLIQFMQDIEVIDIESDEYSDIDPRKTIFVGRDLKVNRCMKLALMEGGMHFVQENRQDLLYDLFASCVMLKTPSKFQSNPIPFFINSFRPDHNIESIRSKTVEISSTVEKIFLMQGLKNFFNENPKTASCKQIASVVADELLSNALFHGPVNQDGRPLNAHLDRSTEIDLKNKKIRIFITHDDSRLLIGCEDPFGSLNFPSVIRRLAKLYAQSKSEIYQSGAGAGLGFKLCIDACIGFYISVKQNHKTLVCCALPLGISRKSAQTFPKNFHFCTF